MIDKQALFSDAQAITVTAYSDYGIDLGARGAKVPLGAENPSEIMLQVITDFDGLGTIYVSLQTADNTSFTNAITIATTETLDLNQLRAGRYFRLGQLPRCMQYIRLYYVVTGTKTAGAITAGLVTEKQTMPGYLNIVDAPLVLVTGTGATVVTDDGSGIEVG